MIRSNRAGAMALVTCVMLGLGAGMAAAADSKQTEQNKQLVTAFYDAAINQKNYEAAVGYLGSQYKQHNPTAADGKVVEHWDVIQDIPEKAANTNGMF